MNQQQLSQISELRYCNIGRTGCLKTLKSVDSAFRTYALSWMAHLDPRYSHTNMCCLNHAYIVRTIADGKKNSLLILLDQLNDKRFLQWRDTALQVQKL